MPTWTEADVAVLKAAVASGVLTVRYDGPPARLITYQSLDSMRALLASMEQQINGTAGKVSFRYAATRKGFWPYGSGNGGEFP